MLKYNEYLLEIEFKKWKFLYDSTNEGLSERC